MFRATRHDVQDDSNSGPRAASTTLCAAPLDAGVSALCAGSTDSAIPRRAIRSRTERGATRGYRPDRRAGAEQPAPCYGRARGARCSASVGYTCTGSGSGSGFARTRAVDGTRARRGSPAGAGTPAADGRRLRREPAAR